MKSARQGIGWVCAGLLALGCAAGRGQNISGVPDPTSIFASVLANPHASGEPASKASSTPAISIPVEPLGFSPPGPLYLGARIRLASLDFVGEDQLLFTFRVPGLIHRETKDPAVEERRIRAVMLKLPAGTVEAEAIWALHDRARYLWMMQDGRFLLRDKDNLQVGDASLALKPYLHFPGPLQWLEVDSLQQYLVTNSDEPLPEKERAGDADSPETAKAERTTRDQDADTQLRMVVRIMQRESGKVILVSRSRAAVHLPINAEGYLGSIQSTNGMEWLVEMNYFSGGNKILGRVDSTCRPGLDFLTQKAVLASACTSTGTQKLIALTGDGRHLWDVLIPATSVWPLRVIAANGLRMVQETLLVNHAVTAYNPLSSEDVKGQVATVYDTATGKVVFTSPVSPILDGGGNVAISPSGRRVAVLNGGAIQVFDLPSPAEMHEVATASSDEK